MRTWYELEIMSLDSSSLGYYPISLQNRPNENAGFDVFASQSVQVEKAMQFIPFGIAVRMIRVDETIDGCQTSDSHFLLAPRSSIYKSGLIMANSMGIIDKSYRGELKAPVWSMSGYSEVKRGERWFQILAPDMGWIRHVRLVDVLPATERGTGGFGSTGA